MHELIERLEKAAGPDRKLDVEIHCAILGHDSSRMDLEGIGHPGSGWTPGDEWPQYTGSIDAALSLVPEGWAWSISAGGCYATGRESKPRAELAEPIQTEFGAGIGVRAQIEAATPAIALCIASLKARNSPPGP